MGEAGHLDNHLPGLSVTARWCDTANEGTADCAMFCRCDDGSDYAVKDTSKHAGHPHSEYLCTKLGEMVGLKEYSEDTLNWDDASDREGLKRMFFDAFNSHHPTPIN